MGARGGGGGEIEFNIKSNLNKNLSVRQAVLYTFGQDCSFSLFHIFLKNIESVKWQQSLNASYVREI